MHWHGYGPWTGPAAELRGEASRRPGGKPTDMETATFVRGQVPPMQTGHYLLRPSTPDRTWTDPDQALEWLAKTAANHPPYGSYVPIEDALVHDRNQLLGGADVYRQYYTGTATVAAFGLIRCPHAHLAGIRCPRPPS